MALYLEIILDMSAKSGYALEHLSVTSTFQLRDSSKILYARTLRFRELLRFDRTFVRFISNNPTTVPALALPSNRGCTGAGIPVITKYCICNCM